MDDELAAEEDEAEVAGVDAVLDGGATTTTGSIGGAAKGSSSSSSGWAERDWAGAGVE